MERKSEREVMGYTLSTYYSRRDKPKKKPTKEQRDKWRNEESKLRDKWRSVRYREAMVPLQRMGYTIYGDKPEDVPLAAFLKYRGYSKKTITAMMRDGNCLEQRLEELNKEGMRMQKYCKICGKEFHATGNDRYCSEDCQVKGYMLKNKERMDKFLEKVKPVTESRTLPKPNVAGRIMGVDTYNKQCIVCGKKFKTPFPAQTSCSPECRAIQKAKVKEATRQAAMRRRLKARIAREMDEAERKRKLRQIQEPVPIIATKPIQEPVQTEQIIHMEELVNKANEWFAKLGWKAQGIIIREYMKANKIDDKNVSWWDKE